MGSEHREELGGGALTIQERAARYNAAFPQFPDSHFKISERWISATWILGNDYRGSGYYGCLDPSTLILTSDLNWIRQDNLRIGDCLVGVTETTLERNQKGNRLKRKILPSYIEQIGEVFLDSSSIVFEDGRKIIASNDHLWLEISADGTSRWVKTEKLRTGARIRKIINPWQKPNPYDAGWIAGALRGNKDTFTGFSICFSQNPGIVRDRYVEILKYWDIDHYLDKKTNVVAVRDVASSLKLLGMSQPLRFRYSWEGVGLPIKKDSVFSTVEKVIPIGMKKLIGMQTSTRTFVAEGLVSHNSYPPGYMPRVSSLFPDTRCPLHLFGGSLRVDTAVHPCGVTVDLRVTDQVRPRVQANALALPFRPDTFDVCFADTPYSDLDAERYATPMPDRRRVLYEVHHVVAQGGYLVWMDTTLPMYRKDMWHWCGAISLWRSTNHRIRGVAIFERL